MRALFLFPLCLALAACQSITRVGADGFEAGPAGAESFGNDDQGCTGLANDTLSYDVRLMGATSYERNRTFNRLYASCMRARGYQPRPYLKNLLPDLG